MPPTMTKKRSTLLPRSPRATPPPRATVPPVSRAPAEGAGRGGSPASPVSETSAGSAGGASFSSPASPVFSRSASSSWSLVAMARVPLREDLAVRDAAGEPLGVREPLARLLPAHAEVLERALDLVLALHAEAHRGELVGREGRIAPEARGAELDVLGRRVGPEHLLVVGVVAVA